LFIGLLAINRLLTGLLRPEDRSLRPVFFYHKEVADKRKIALEDEKEMQQLIQELESTGYSKSADTAERIRFSLWNYRAFPREHWRRIRTTNGLERINKELKRRSRVVGAFPSDQSFMRL
jgi:putative transposase